MSPLAIVLLLALVTVVCLIAYRHLRHFRAHPGGCAHCAAQNCPHRKRPRQND